MNYYCRNCGKFMQQSGDCCGKCTLGAILILLNVLAVVVGFSVIAGLCAAA